MGIHKLTHELLAGFLMKQLEFWRLYNGDSLSCRLLLCQNKQELSHDSIARLICALPITKTIGVIR